MVTICNGYTICKKGNATSVNHALQTRANWEVNPGREIRKRMERLEMMESDGFQSWLTNFSTNGLKDPMLMKSLMENEPESSSLVGCLAAFYTLQSKPYYLSVLDAWGKPASGLSRLNTYWPGNYDLCRDVRDAVHDPLYKGQYCLLVSEEIYQNSFRIGACVPPECTEEDLCRLLPRLNIPPAAVQCTQPPPLDAEAILGIVVLALLLLPALIGTIYDIVLQNKKKSKTEKNEGTNKHHSAVEMKTVHKSIEKASINGNVNIAFDGSHQDISPASYSDVGPPPSPPNKYRHVEALGRFFLCFSWWTNGSKILDTQIRDKKLACLNGIRVLSISWVILGHTFSLFIDRIDSSATFFLTHIPSFASQAIINATVAVDSFFVLGGLLLAFLTLKQMKKQKGFTGGMWGMFYFHRFWRLTPTLALFVLLYAGLAVHLPDGPYSMYMLGNQEVCRKYWWATLLYIANYVPDGRLGSLCVGWTWYLMIDMQLFVISPFILYLLFRRPKVGVALCCLLICINIAVSWPFAYKYRIGGGLSGAEGKDQVSDVMGERLYIYTYHRMATWVIGILAGYLLYATNCKIKMHMVLVFAGWLVAAGLCMTVVYAMYIYNHELTPMPRGLGAAWMALNRPAWALGVAWVIVACATGHGGPVNWMLSWKVWVPLARLSFMAYMIHILIIDCFSMSARTRIPFTNLYLVVYFLAFSVMTFGASLVMSLIIEAPTMRLEKLMFDKKRR